MNKIDLTGKKIAILAADGFEQSELLKPKKALEKLGAVTEVISINEGSIRGWNEKKWGKSVDVDQTTAGANPEDYDALLLPGGVMNPDTLRNEPEAVEFVRTFFNTGRPVAAICHGPWTLINAEVVEGRRMTSYPSIRKDLENAGAEWVDEEVVVDNGLVTSRKPDDIPAFIDKFVEEILEGIHERRLERPSLAGSFAP